MSQSTIVRLPNDQDVELCLDPTCWETSTQEVIVYVKPSWLAPDLDQPRKDMREYDLTELSISVKAEGVREPITVTPAVVTPWARVAMEHRQRPFIIVSGHRRQLAAIAGNLPAVPIRIVVYETEQAHRDDAALLNVQRADMAPLDEAREIRRRQQLGMSLEVIARSYGKSVAWALGRNALNDLPPDIQTRLNPNLPRTEQVPLLVAIALGKLKVRHGAEVQAFAEEYGVHIPPYEEANLTEVRFAMQRAFLHVIEREGYRTTRATEFIDDVRRFKRDAAAPRNRSDGTKRYEPYNRVEKLQNWVKGIEEGLPLTWSGAEITRIFNGYDQDKIELVIDRVRAAEAALVSFREELESVQRGLPKRTTEVQ